VSASRFLFSLCVLALLTSTTPGAEAPAPIKHYVFELETLDLGDKVRRGRTSFPGAVEFKIASAMSEDDLDAVNDILDDLGASRPDAEGYRDFSMSNGTRARVGGFGENPEVAGAGVQSLPVEFSVKDEFSTAEAAVVLQLAAEGNLFVTSSSDPTLAATKTQVIDKRFLRRHKNYSVTPDDTALAEWVRKNIPPHDAADEPRQ
jgi:hypothetical protein